LQSLICELHAHHIFQHAQQQKKKKEANGSLSMDIPGYFWNVAMAKLPD
jgi:hypothetical protein